MALSAITDNLIAPIMKHYLDGKDTPFIQTWLEAEHNIKLSIRSINEKMATYRSVEKQAKRDAIANAASKQALDYVDIIDKNIAKLDKHIMRLLESETQNALRLAATLQKTMLTYIDAQMKLVGMQRQDKDISHSEKEQLDNLLANLEDKRTSIYRAAKHQADEAFAPEAPLNS